jgi:hypothetical protein
MWLAGILAMMALVGVAAGLLAKLRSPGKHTADWDLQSLSGAYAAIVAPLAGFSVAATVFLANLTSAAKTPYFADIMVLFLVAFILLMGTAIMFATFRSAKLVS